MSLNMKEVMFNTLNAHFFFHLGRWIKLKSHYSLMKIISMVSQTNILKKYACLLNYFKNSVIHRIYRKFYI